MGKLRSSFGTAGAIVLGAAMAIALLFVAGRIDIGQTGLGGPTSSGCEAYTGTITESTQFTPWEMRRSHLPEYPLTSLGAALTSAPDSSIARGETPDGLAPRWGVVAADGSEYLYFFDRPINSTITVTRFYAAGGLFLGKDPHNAAANSEEFDAILAARSTTVSVGEYAATLTWADPLADGTRTHNLFWTDGKHDYSLIGDRSPADLIDIARSMVCA